ncbi:UDP-N-acetylmuramoyl-L-alanyl-D-glutamate--2,6-diaminopimelate ligase [Candidatus Uhrbacteria bacterium]|nr:UDP-N-acetylmuramoyl-L-alanyl-D-glutamate--2,6-diaminopimelate ligase [Candidatus Uhrbacteria bacterium]
MKTFFKKILSQKIINLLWHYPRAVLAATLNSFPAKKLTVIGIAGTKGKTSTAYILSHILDSASIPNALLSTAALKIRGEENPNLLKMTSPDVFFLNAFLKKVLAKGCTHVIIEVSSHAIDQYRVWGIPFSIVLLTNLTPDHLEYHTSAQEYQSIHTRIVTPHHTTLILNAEDTATRKFRAVPKQKIFFTSDGPVAHALAKKNIPLMDGFQKINIIAAITASLALDISPHAIFEALHTLKTIPGRCEYIEAGQSFKIIIDYAHSPLSLYTFFEALPKPKAGQIITVFGACGERDSSTRAPMGDLLDRYSDIIIITNDDPYSEDPAKIANEVLAGIKQKNISDHTLYTILDRREAIQKAITLARHDTTVCILGKGAEQWQVFAHEKIPWDDRLVVREILKGIYA